VRAVDVTLFGALLMCCYTDLKYRKVLNIIIFPAILAAFIINVYLLGLEGVAFCGKGIFVGLALLLIPYILGGIGAGDVKLLGMVGAFKGTTFVLYAFLAAALVGGAFAIIFMLRKRVLLSSLLCIGRAIKVFLISQFKIWNLARIDDNDGNDFETLPYGLAISLGTMICLLWVS